MSLYVFSCYGIWRLCTELIERFQDVRYSEFDQFYSLSLSLSLSLSFHLGTHNKGEAPFPSPKVLIKEKEKNNLRRN
jgi:hypothetical protein